MHENQGRHFRVLNLQIGSKSKTLSLVYIEILFPKHQTQYYKGSNNKC